MDLNERFEEIRKRLAECQHSVSVILGYSLMDLPPHAVEKLEFRALALKEEMNELHRKAEELLRILKPTT